MGDTPRRADRGIGGLALSFATLLLATLGERLFGAWLVELLWASAQEGIEGDPARVLENFLTRFEALTAGALAFAWSVFGLVALCLCLWRFRPRWWVGSTGVLGAYLLLELLAVPCWAPFLGLRHVQLIRDPDHLPTDRAGEAGWNRDHLAQVREPEEYTAEDFNVVFLGDSFTMGLKLERPHRQAFPHLVEARLREALARSDIQVANFAWVSSSPLLSLRRLQDLGDRYHPDLVVLCLDMTDPHDDIKYANLIERRGITGLYDRLPLTIQLTRKFAPGTFRWLYDWSTDDSLPSDRFFHSAQPLEASRPFLRPTLRWIERIRDESERLEAPFVLFVLPRYYQYTDQECPDDWEMERFQSHELILGPHCQEPFRFFEELAARVDYPVHSLLPAFETTTIHPHCFRDDPHWNAQGHEIAATAITDLLLPQVRALLEDH